VTRRATVQITVGLVVAALWLQCVLYFTSGGYAQFWFFMVAPFSVSLTALVAAPLVYLFRRRISFTLCCGFGLTIGLLGSLLFLATTNPLAALHWSPAFLLVGLSSSIIFWSVGVWRNRDLTIGSSDRGVASSVNQEVGR
jgi:hypothetical protein